MKFVAIFAIIILSLVFVVATPDSAFAHKSGCHRWHSCPSDSGSYVCGDLGYDTYCPKSVEPKKEVKKQTTPSMSAECKGTALCITDKVTKIVDGDTIYLKDYKIRLSLTNTPEKGERGFNEATSFTKKLCPVGSTITVDQDDKQPYDKYKRVVGKVTCSGKVLNSELLYNGYANILKQYCSKSEFSGEAWAQKYGCGTTTQELKQQIQKESQTPTPTKENQCDPSYPDVCIPPYPPDLDCGDVPYKNFKVLPPDPHGFDRDKDGIGCEK